MSPIRDVRRLRVLGTREGAWWSFLEIVAGDALEKARGLPWPGPGDPLPDENALGASLVWSGAIWHGTLTCRGSRAAGGTPRKRCLFRRIRGLMLVSYRWYVFRGRALGASGPWRRAWVQPHRQPPPRAGSLDISQARTSKNPASSTAQRTHWEVRSDPISMPASSAVLPVQPMPRCMNRRHGAEAPWTSSRRGWKELWLPVRGALSEKAPADRAREQGGRDGPGFLPGSPRAGGARTSRSMSTAGPRGLAGAGVFSCLEAGTPWRDPGVCLKRYDSPT